MGSHIPLIRAYSVGQGGTLCIKICYGKIQSWLLLVL